MQVVNVKGPDLPETREFISDEAINHMKDHDTFVPSHNLGCLLRYFEQGLRPGSFMSAILTNDLQEAVGRADDINQRHIPGMIRWLYNYAPAGSWGSPEAVEEFLKDHPFRKNMQES